ncbi:hypothetical protein BOTBODRAFT_159594 [Botryobasidium botryosum FD-172 SS1]|uniref:Uncharacterized protein n=1 Tax=Botryobasidium botryosum (strain FD-172 SS1) TaxID=930990 RepID=A0A067MRB5_BOTB1|nr:hypothetical protein BOTBODRAFT_159594 [Botryobasidium botryosum FD-172 SS1]
MGLVFEILAALIGISSDQLKLIFCLIISYPLGSVFVRIPKSWPAVKHLFNIAVSTWFLVGLLELWSGTAQLLASILFTYYAAKNLQGPNMPWIVFAVTMSHLTVNHIIRMVGNIGPETVEITGTQMVMTMKLTTFAWNVWDGRQQEAELDKSQLETRITKFPSLLAFLGYVFYFPGVLVGPTIEYASYDALVTETLFDSGPKGKGGRSVPDGRKRVAYWKMLSGIFFLILFAIYGSTYSYDVVLEDWWLTKPLFWRIGYTQILGFIQRTKYYGVWLLTEGSCILTGLGFNGFNAAGKTQWNRMANVDVLHIEFGENVKVLLDSWNMNTNVWLRNCVYKRVTPKGKKPGFRSSMVTFGTSAFWHGLYGGYYLTFMLGGFIQTVARMCRKNIRPLFISPTDTSPSLSKRLYDVAGTLSTLALINYAVAPFCILDLRRSLQAWSRMGWYGHLVVAATMAFFYSGGGRLLGAAKAKTEGEGRPTKVKMPPVDPGHVSPLSPETPSMEPQHFVPPLHQIVPPPKTD